MPACLQAFRFPRRKASNQNIVRTGGLNGCYRIRQVNRPLRRRIPFYKSFSLCALGRDAERETLSTSVPICLRR
jgi:hypothetical protein